jgi:hypothetical protein
MLVVHIVRVTVDRDDQRRRVGMVTPHLLTIRISCDVASRAGEA